MGPSQPKVTNEVWDDDRVASFLDINGVNANNDFNTLLKAYRGMRSSDFARFLDLFLKAGRDPDAKDARGRTLWSIIKRHRQGADFIALRNSR